MPPIGVVRSDRSLGMPPKARGNPPQSTTYRVYSKVLDGLQHDSRNMSQATKNSRAFFGRLQDNKKRTWVAYHLLFRETNEWRLFWFLAPPKLATPEHQMKDLQGCITYRPWHQHPGPQSDRYPIGYEGATPYLEADLGVNPYVDERQVQKANIRKVDEILYVSEKPRWSS